VSPFGRGSVGPIAANMKKPDCAQGVNLPFSRLPWRAVRKADVTGIGRITNTALTTLDPPARPATRRKEHE
jgi:hypothetical protein